MPKVSVIVPVYGVEQFIERCARSLFEQTLDDIEYLFIDDCSPDNSIRVLRHILQEFPERKSQVIIHRMECNSGQAKVREWGMRNATGEFIIHCDSDDWVEKEAYQVMYLKALQDKADIVVCDYAMNDGNNIYKIIHGYSAKSKRDFVRLLMYQRNPWSLCNKMFRRKECYKEGLLYPVGNMGEDMVLTFQMLLNGDKVVYVPQSLYNYYYNVYSITHVPSEEKQMINFSHFKSNVDLLINFFNERGLYETFSDGIENIKWHVKKLIWNMPYNKERNILWKNTYKDINKKVLLNNHISSKEKMKFLLTIMNLYPKRKDYYERKEF